ncbi:TetR/AcrR family transcriptional regulator [Roseiconus nitratireducens]|uniref:TetR/AcrR family transcriptional regulator n=1 Tax=Roseiconus nitratireducens TaxID=2605748 RepID=A0A5M6DGX7_9BACT|nr:TetR/AcrR family transcriptional regulator [Roseiconus nitratireducens]KAA5545530.1 TetR/AcrR family transcriptional regulator [Roseiconus nitratireducens]
MRHRNGNAKSPTRSPGTTRPASVSVPLTPKQAEIRSREIRILQQARPMVVRGGLSGLSMEAIAKKMSYAKGTIYNHFSCKEEILLALAIQANEIRLRLFESAIEGQQRSRDKIAAIGVACEDFCHRFDDLFGIDAMVRHVTVWEKASEQRRETLADCEQRCMGLVARIGHEAVATGDLTLPPNRAVEDVVFGLWSLTYGGSIIEQTSPGLDQIGIQDAFAAIRRNCHALMDGYHWHPLYDDQQDRRLVRRVRSALKRRVPRSLAEDDLFSESHLQGRELKHG